MSDDLTVGRITFGPEHPRDVVEYLRGEWPASIVRLNQPEQERVTKEMTKDVADILMREHLADRVNHDGPRLWPDAKHTDAVYQKCAQTFPGEFEEDEDDCRYYIARDQLRQATRRERWYDRWLEIRYRVRNAWHVLRYGYNEDDQ